MNIQKTIDTMEIPEGLSKDELFDFFTDTYYHELDCDPETLREAVGVRLMREQDKILRQNLLDVMAGKYHGVEDMKQRMPLFRDGDTLRNIPKSIIGWYGFMAWANELAMGA